VGISLTDLPNPIGQILNFQNFEIKNSKKTRVHFNIFGQNGSKNLKYYVLENSVEYKMV
jgi:hypothetical protein